MEATWSSGISAPDFKGIYKKNTQNNYNDIT